MELPSYFLKYLSNIQPAEERVSAVSEAHATLRNHLVQDSTAKWAAESSLLGGSYARDTACHPIKDADVILSLKTNNVSEEQTKPSPVDVLEDLKSCLEDFYEEVDLREQRRSIRVTVEGETVDDSVLLDVVPSISPQGMDKVLWVPDRERRKWIKSNPIGYVNHASNRNGKTGGRYVKIVKTVKAWASASVQEQLRPKSFLLEAMVDHTLATSAKGLPRTLLGTMQGLLAWLDPCAKNGTLPEVTDPSLSTNDLAKSCRWSVDSLKALVFELRKAENTLRRAIDESDKARSIKLWRDVLGSSFPESLDEEASKLGESDEASPTKRQTFHYKVSLKAHLAKEKGAETYEEYHSGGRKLDKGTWIRFDIVNCNVPGDYKIKWQVTNHGREARQKPKDLKHHTYPGTDTQWESTKYKGHHYMDCEIWKDGKRVALTRFQVNVV